jgi:cell division protein ZapA
MQGTEKSKTSKTNPATNATSVQKVAGQKALYEVQVAGLNMKLRSSHDEKTVLNLVQLINSKVDEAMKANGTVTFQNALVLAALNIAEELLLLKTTAATELDRIESRTRLILEQIEDVTTPSNS